MQQQQLCCSVECPFIQLDIELIGAGSNKDLEPFLHVAGRKNVKTIIAALNADPCMHPTAVPTAVAAGGERRQIKD